MKLWIVRHGQTDLNLKKLMQTYTDEPLNATGVHQAEEMRDQLRGVSFDAVYSSELIRAVTTAAIISGWAERDVIRDTRLTEVNFGKYEKRSYYRLGPKMSLYWLMPETFPAPRTVESTPEVRSRIRSFLSDLRGSGAENVLICSHGNLLRVLFNELEGRPHKITFRDFVHNCEIRSFEI